MWEGGGKIAGIRIQRNEKRQVARTDVFRCSYDSGGIYGKVAYGASCDGLDLLRPPSVSEAGTVNKRPNQSAVKSGPALGVDASATVTKQSNVPEKRTALTRRIHYHVLSKHPSSPERCDEWRLVFCTCRSNSRRAKLLLFPSRAGGSESGRAVFPGSHLVCPPPTLPPTVSRIGGRYQQCAEAIYGGEEIYINQPADGGHALRKLRRGVWAPPSPLAE